jgi:TonB family protein
MPSRHLAGLVASILQTFDMHRPGFLYSAILMVCLYGSGLPGQVDRPPLPKVEEIFAIIKNIPSFPGCEHLGDRIEQRQCADKKLLAFIYKNLEYPEKARRQKKEGDVLVQFIVEKDGSVKDAQVVSLTPNGFEEEGLRLIHLMRKKGYKWNPGPSAGLPMRALFQLSVEFKLEEERPLSYRPELAFVKEMSRGELLVPPPPPPPPMAEDSESVVITTSVDELPLFPGCEDLPSYADKKACADKKMLEFIYGNITTPKIPPEEQVHGMVVVTFIVEKNGSISNVKTVRDIGFGIGAEVERVINLMSSKGIKFNPGKSGGRTKRVRFNIPVKFHIGCT